MRSLTFRKKLVLGWVLAVAVVAGVAFVVWPREPVYEGKRLSYWLDHLPVYTRSPHADAAADYLGLCPAVSRTGSPVSRTEMKTAVKALNALSTQSLPMLVNRLGAKVTLKAMQLYEVRLFARKCGLSRIVAMELPPSLAAAICRNQAVFAIVDLGDRSKPILPAVVKLATNDPDPGVHDSALEVLHRLSPNDYAQVAGQTNVVSAAAR